jgi:hypothetical protein
MTFGKNSAEFFKVLASPRDAALTATSQFAVYQRAAHARHMRKHHFRRTCLT